MDKRIINKEDINDDKTENDNKNTATVIIDFTNIMILKNMITFLLNCDLKNLIGQIQKNNTLKEEKFMCMIFFKILQ